VEDRDALMARLLEYGRVSNFEIRMRRRDGTPVWVLENMILADGEKGPVVEGTLVDISKRKRAEEALEQAAKRFHLVTLATQDAIFDWDLVTHDIWRNENYRRLFGAPERSLDSENWWADRLHPEDRDRAVVALDAALGSEASLFSAEYRLRCPDGSYAHIIDRAYIVRNTQGQPVRMIGALSDLTERRRVEEALRESEKLYRLLAENVTDVIWTSDLDLRYTYISPAVMRLRGVTVEEAMAEKTEETLTPSSLKVAKGALAEELSKESIPQEDPSRSRTLELEQTCKDGSTVWTEVRATLLRDPGGRPVGILGVTRDISARQRAEEALRESEERFRLLAETMPDAVLVGQDGRNVYANAAVAHLLRAAGPEELVGFDVFALIAPTHHEWAQQQMQRALAGEKQPPFEDRFVRLDGSSVPVEIAASLLTWQGWPALQVVVRDVTERKRAEESLRESEERFRSLVENATIGIYRTTPQGRILMANPAVVAMLKCESLEELLARNLEEHGFEPGYPRQAFRERIERDGEVRGLEAAWTRQDGSAVFVRESAHVVRGESGNVLYYDGIVEDITERRQAEETLQRSRDQLRALTARVQRVREEERTRVAREIHDELGQDLTAIKIDLSSLSQEFSADKKQQCESILKLVDETIQSLRRISTELRPAILDAAGLVAAIEWAVEEFGARTGTKCRLDLPPDDVVIDQERATALFRILQETLTNVARHANATEVKVRLAKADGTLTLEVHDNGKGVGRAQLSHSASLGILGMRERALVLGGKLTITGGPGKGTTVRVQIPDVRHEWPE